jgi:hypothetical protein
MNHIYRKAFDHEFEAAETSKGFHRLPGIDGRHIVETSIKSVDGKYWVYVTLMGDVDTEQLQAATGFEIVH